MVKLDYCKWRVSVKTWTKRGLGFGCEITPRDLSQVAKQISEDLRTMMEESEDCLNFMNVSDAGRSGQETPLISHDKNFRHPESSNNEFHSIQLAET